VFAADLPKFPIQHEVESPYTPICPFLINIPMHSKKIISPLSRTRQPNEMKMLADTQDEEPENVEDEPNHKRQHQQNP
jgi:hypothetical protein